MQKPSDQRNALSLGSSHEAPALLSARLTVATKSCWLAETQAGDLLGYLFSYPAASQHLTALASPFEPAVEAEVLYLHDMAVNINTRGVGIAAALLNHAEQHAKTLELTALSLVAVQNSHGFWQKQGFAIHSNLPLNANLALQSYPEGAVAMHKSLTTV